MIPFAFIGRNRVLFQDDFENSGGSLRSAWSINNFDQTNQWHVGSATFSSGTQSAYISRDSGANNIYNAGADASYCWFDIFIPYDAIRFRIYFDWKCNGEISSSTTAYNNYDFGFIMFCLTSFLPSAGATYGASGTGYERVDKTVTAGRISGDNTYSTARNALGDTQWITDFMEIDNTYNDWATGVNRRIVFGWQNDGSLEQQPPIAIDNLRVTYTESSFDPPL
jgi:hypothetical protein